MHEFDAVLKILLRKAVERAVKRLGGVKVVRWLNVEMQHVSVGRADLVGLTADGEIIHIELQATNDPDMAVRMAEYALAIFRQYKSFPRQIVLYVGEKTMNMKAKLEIAERLNFQYTLIDIRDFDTAELMDSGQIEDNLLTILTRLQDQKAVIRAILGRISGLDDAARRAAFAQFLIISGLRRLGQTIQEEASKMPILNDILEHDLLGPAILQGRQEGREEGIQEGRREGRREGRQEGIHAGMLKLLRQMLEGQLGSIPEWVEPRLANLASDELTQAASRVPKSASYEELFGSPG